MFNPALRLHLNSASTNLFVFARRDGIQFYDYTFVIIALCDYIRVYEYMHTYLFANQGENQNTQTTTISL